MIPSDLGRPLAHLTHRLQSDELPELASSVLQTLHVVEREVQTQDGRRYLARLLPYRSLEDRIDGVVMTFVEVSDLRNAVAARDRSEAALQAIEQRLRFALRTAPMIVIGPDAELRTTWGYLLGEELELADCAGAATNGLVERLAPEQAGPPPGRAVRRSGREGERRSGPGQRVHGRAAAGRGERRGGIMNLQSEPTQLGRVRVLVVDDYPDSAEISAMLLELFGHECRTATTGQEALAHAATFDPDIVILDIGLPDISGYEVARTLRAQPRDRPLYLAAVTGWGQPEDRVRALAAGFDLHVLKPTDGAKIQNILSLAIEAGVRASS